MGATRTVGRFALHGEIASGGMATVHYGWGDDGLVAVKCLRRDLATDEEVRAMLLDEARVTSHVAHPNVVRTLEVIAEEDDLVLVMEYVAGESLAEALAVAEARGERVPPPIAAAIMLDVLAGVHAAHEARDAQGEPLELVHRDLSPHNVLIAEDGTARVLDFGIAKARGRLTRTATGALKGKVAYMAPEQVHGETSRQSDMFALGVILWEMLVGTRLFEGRSRAETLAKVLGARVALPSHHGVVLPSGLEAAVMRALARDRAGRFATADEMRRAIAGSGPVADHADVARWLADLVGERLARKRAEVGAITGAAHAVPRVEEATARMRESVPGARRPHRARSGIALMVALGLAFGAALAVFAGVPAAAPAPARAAPPIASEAPEAPTTPSLAPIAEPSPSAQEPSGEGSASPTAAKGRAARPVRVEPRATTSAARPGCDPPYRRDASGHITWKRECL